MTATKNRATRRAAAKGKAPAKMAPAKGKAGRIAALANVGKAAAAKPAAAPKPMGKRAALEAAAAAGDLTAVRPDFTAPTHDSWRNHIAAVDALIADRDISGLEAFVADQAFWEASSTRKAINRWVQRSMTALRANGAKPAKPATAEKRAGIALTAAKADRKAELHAAKAQAAMAAAKAARAGKADESAPARKAPAKPAAKAPAKGKGKAPAMAAKAAPAAKAGKRK